MCSKSMVVTFLPDPVRHAWLIRGAGLPTGLRLGMKPA